MLSAIPNLDSKTERLNPKWRRATSGRACERIGSKRNGENNEWKTLLLTRAARNRFGYKNVSVLENCEKERQRVGMQMNGIVKTFRRGISNFAQLTPCPSLSLSRALALAGLTDWQLKLQQQQQLLQRLLDKNIVILQIFLFFSIERNMFSQFLMHLCLRTHSKANERERASTPLFSFRFFDIRLRSLAEQNWNLIYLQARSLSRSLVYYAASTFCSPRTNSFRAHPPLLYKLRSNRTRYIWLMSQISGRSNEKDRDSGGSW